MFFVVVADRRLGRGSKDRLGQFLGLTQAVGQFDAADLAGALVILPTAADQIAACDRFHRYRFELARDHRAFGVQGRVHALGQDLFHADVHQVVGHQVFGLVEPEVGHLAQHLALAGNRVGQHHVERGQTIGSHHQQVVARGGIGGQAVAGDIEDIADLATVTQRQAGQIGLQQRGRHRHS